MTALFHNVNIEGSNRRGSSNFLQGGGGVQPSQKIGKSKKKKKGRKKEGGEGVSVFHSTPVWSKSNLATETAFLADNALPWCFRDNNTFVKIVSRVVNFFFLMGGGGGLGSSPRKFMDLMVQNRGL